MKLQAVYERLKLWSERGEEKTITLHILPGGDIEMTRPGREGEAESIYVTDYVTCGMSEE